MTAKYLFVGDLCLSEWNKNSSDSYESTCQRWKQLTEQADLTVANLESCLVEDDGACDKFIAVSRPDCEVIETSGIDVLSMANNHILDCGDASLEFARTYLREVGIQTVGAGKNIREASAPLILTKDGCRIGIIASTDATHYKATKYRAGISPLSFSAMTKSIKAIADKVDIIILSIHSDLEFTNYPAPWKVRLSRKLAKAGADIIIHHHPHTLQGIEIYEGTLIAYSLGNFVFPVHGREYMQSRDGDVDEATILEVTVNFIAGNNKDISYRLIPTVIDEDNNTVFADEKKAMDINSKMSLYSHSLSNRRLLRRHYLKLCLKQANTFIWGTYYTLCKGGVLSAYRYLHTHISTGMHRNWMRGVFTLGWF